MRIVKAMHRMIDLYRGNLHDIEHFLKVHQYASLIGRSAGLDADTQEQLELTAIVHDIACPLCREKYGSAKGSYQEAESEPLVRAFFADFDLPPQMLERIVYLVCHHHTYTGVDGADYQILLEADYLVNASEQHASADSVREFCSRVVKTPAAQRLFDSIYLG